MAGGVWPHPWKNRASQLGLSLQIGMENKRILGNYSIFTTICIDMRAYIYIYYINVNININKQISIYIYIYVYIYICIIMHMYIYIYTHIRAQLGLAHPEPQTRNTHSLNWFPKFVDFSLGKLAEGWNFAPQEKARQKVTQNNGTYDVNCCF